MSDVHLTLENDGGEITSTNGSIELDDGLESAVVLSLFGGNEDDSGLAGDDALTWWGNVDEPDQSRKYRSETQNLLRALAATPVNIKRVEDAVGRDLDWMIQTETASAVDVAVSIPALNHFQIDVSITIRDRVFESVFLQRSGSSSS